MMKEPYSPAKAWLVCQVWAFMLFLPVAADFTTSHNRYLLHWSVMHMWVFLAMIVGIGSIFFAVGLMLRRCQPAAYGPTASIMAFASLLFLVRFFVTLWTSKLITIDLMPFGIILALLAVLVLHRRGYLEKLRYGLSRAALFMAFMLPIFVLTGFSYRTYPEPNYPALADIPDRQTEGPLQPADNVYVFIFDGWSYRLTFQDGKPNDSCPNLQKLAENMCVFTNGHSPGCHTITSIPRLLFEREDLFCLQEGEPGFWKNDAFHPSQTEPGVFAKARERGFRTYMVGWHHNYHAMLNKQVDYLHQIASTELVDHSPLGIAADYGWKWAEFGPVLGRPIRSTFQLKQNYSFYWQNEALLREASEVLVDPRPQGQFAVMHLPLPHQPFIYNSKGCVCDFEEYYPETVSLCKDQIMYLDHVIGKFVDSLKKQGKYENSIVVFTSDHTWRNDPEVERTGKAFTHVPFMVHFPGQKQYIRVDEPFTTLNLMRLLDHVHAHNGKLDDLDQAIRDNGWFFPVPDHEVFMEKLVSK
jgi:glucan phosphoethanolaminetransferase (alkaline phosphatase superfamily)